MKLIFHGAEAKVYLLEPEDKRNNKYIYRIPPNVLSGILNEDVNSKLEISYEKNRLILKARYKKTYRHTLIDREFRKYRTRTEYRILKKLNGKLSVPKAIYTIEDLGILIMEYVEGRKLSELIENLDYKEILYRIGKMVGRMHRCGIIHGDLTTSNIIYKDNVLYLIDFGLSFFSNRIEDYAVDIHLFKESLESKHWRIFMFFEEFLDGYKESFVEKAEVVFRRLEDIERRGRYKSFI